MPDDSAFAPADVARVVEFSTASVELVSVLRDELRAAEGQSAFWTSLSEYLAKEWPAHVCGLMEADADLLKSMRAQGAAGVSLLESLYLGAKEQSRRNTTTFPALIERAAKTAGLPLNMELSRHPIYYFHGQFFKLQVDDTKRRARISTTEGDLAAMPSDVGAIVERLALEEQRVFGRKVVRRSFMAAVRKAYMAEVKANNEKAGAAIPIRPVVKRLQRAVKGFRRDEFLADLTQLIRDEHTAIDGYVMDLQQTKSPNEGVLLPGLEDRGYMGFIIFLRR